MAQPSCLKHLAVLQAHGLSSALLERFASFCAQSKTGSFVFHVNRWQVLAFEEHHKRRVSEMEEAPPLANVPPRIDVDERPHAPEPLSSFTFRPSTPKRA